MGQPSFPALPCSPGRAGRIIGKKQVLLACFFHSFQKISRSGQDLVAQIKGAVHIQHKQLGALEKFHFVGHTLYHPFGDARCGSLVDFQHPRQFLQLADDGQLVHILTGLDPHFHTDDVVFLLRYRQVHQFAAQCLDLLDGLAHGAVPSIDAQTGTSTRRR